MRLFAIQGICQSSQLAWKGMKYRSEIIACIHFMYIHQVLVLYFTWKKISILISVPFLIVDRLLEKSLECLNIANSEGL